MSATLTLKSMKLITGDLHKLEQWQVQVGLSAHNMEFQSYVSLFHLSTTE